MARSMLAFATRRMPWAAAMRLILSASRDGIHRRRGSVSIQVHSAADELVRRDAPQHDVRVGNRGPAAFAIAGRSGIGARAFRTHAQQAAFIHARDGAAARADRVDIEHRNANRKSADGGLQRFARLAVAEAYIGGSAAHVEAQNAREA